MQFHLHHYHTESIKLEPIVASHSLMGNRIENFFPCFAGSEDISDRFDRSTFLGDSIFYVRPPYPLRFSSEAFTSKVTFTTFRSVSSAIVSANSSSISSNSIDDSLQQSAILDSSASFKSSGFFIPMKMNMVPPQPQHIPHGLSVVGGFIKGSYDRVLNNGGGSIDKSLEPLKNHNLKNIVFHGENTISENKWDVNAKVRSELKLHGVEGRKFLDEGGAGNGLLMGCQDLHWAQGRAGEDRLHIVICENHGWVFAGIYDGFHGPDATDYLLNNLFFAVVEELKGKLCSHNFDMATCNSLVDSKEKVLLSIKGNGVDDGCCTSSFNKENNLEKNDNLDCTSEIVEGMNHKNGNEEVDSGEIMDLEKRTIVELGLAKAKIGADWNHSDDVLRALSEAMKKTEDAFLKTVDEMIGHNPELAMMGSCVLIMLMKGEDVYLMNVGDSRAVLATQGENPLQLTMEHNTNEKEEVHRIMMEHLDDPFAVTKGRVKGSLSVTRAFGVGFLKQPKLNDAVLEIFKVNYIGDSPYMTCCPSLYHHRLTPNDKFLILSSDGLYQYFTNEEAVAKVESFITMFPDRDPAQLLIEETLSRAAKKAGMSFQQLLDIPQGERRLYHDDISIVIISLEGKIWRSTA